MRSTMYDAAAKKMKAQCSNFGARPRFKVCAKFIDNNSSGIGSGDKGHLEDSRPIGKYDDDDKIIACIC